MTTTPTDPDWHLVDQGWGRAATEFAALSEPADCREYVAVHHHPRVDRGDRPLDMAGGAGLAIELATLRNASCAGIDAAPRPVAVARDRTPDADVRAGDMAELPFRRAAVSGAQERVGHGLPLRARIAVVHRTRSWRPACPPAVRRPVTFGRPPGHGAPADA